LLINDFNYGCWKTLRRAKEQFTINFGWESVKSQAVRNRTDVGMLQLILPAR
jgi:hypothetical protein